MSGWDLYPPWGVVPCDCAACANMFSARAETVGARELEMLLRARNSAGQQGVVISHNGQQDRERLALRRLTKRGLFLEPNAFGGGWVQWLYRYNLTERGRTCWIRARSER